jgi:hypothetical protein
VEELATRFDAVEVHEAISNENDFLSIYSGVQYFFSSLFLFPPGPGNDS